MKFRCSSCRLRMNSLHFHLDDYYSAPALAGICDICRQAGIAVDDFTNRVIENFAEVTAVNFVGKKCAEINNVDLVKPVSGTVAEARGHLNRYLENLITNYDTNELIQKQINRIDFNDVLFSIMTGSIQPTLTGDYKVDFDAIGLHVEYDLNDLDFISREMIRHKYNNICQYCGREGRSIDHMNPVSLSDDNTMENLTLACQECNEIKGNMPYQFFVAANQKLQRINEKLVEYENMLVELQNKFDQQRNMLIARTHLLNVIQNPELDTMRKQNKEMQAAIDSLYSDYLELRQSRRKYFSTLWKLEQVKQEDYLI